MCFFWLLCFLCFYCYYVFIDVRLSHRNKDYLLIYLLKVNCRQLTFQAKICIAVTETECAYSTEQYYTDTLYWSVLDVTQVVLALTTRTRC